MKPANIKTIVRALVRLGGGISTVERACVAGFLRMRGFSIPANSFLTHYLKNVPTNRIDACCEILKPLGKSLDLEKLIELFELLVESETRKKNGVAYTPLSVKRMMLERALRNLRTPTVFDPSCGCAAFLITAARMIHRKTALKYADIVPRCVFGADVDAGALEKTRALFSILLIENGEEVDALPELFELNMLRPESVAVILAAHPKGFDCVVGNPPYVRARNLKEDVREDVSLWTTSRCGNADLYMPFFEIGMSLVSQTGRLTYITPNTYLQSVNGRSLRNWMADKRLSVDITDFRNTQLFANVTCYTCVTILDRLGKAGISYRRASAPDSVAKESTFYLPTAFGRDEPWRMRPPEVDVVVRRLEETGKPLGDYVIRNGLATLANDVFFFRPTAEEGSFFVREFGGKLWKIEKNICRPLVKPNVIHDEKELKSAVECAIFPYLPVGGRLVVMPEEELKRDFPFTHSFLLHCRPTLDRRDKGKGDYPTWYAYGRTQGMNVVGRKLLIPYIAGRPTAVLAFDRNLLFYCGYALIDDDIDELRYIKVFLESEAFWYYISHTSKPYSKGFMALAKNYIVRFSIPDLPSEARNELLATRSHEDRDRLVWKAYGFANSPPPSLA